MDPEMKEVGIVSGSSKGSKRGSHSVSRMEVEPADNGGYTVTTHFKSNKNGASRFSGPSDYKEPHKGVFTHIDHAIDHIKKHLGGKASKKKG